MHKTNSDQFEVRLTINNAEVLAAQKLRYKVFVKEFGAKVSKEHEAQLVERDKFDPYCDHLVLIDKRAKNRLSGSNIVGTMRLMESRVAHRALGFYSATEYDLDKLTTEHKKSLEIGRACVDIKYRGSLAIHFLWLGLAEYSIKREIVLLFGVASFHGTNASKFGSALTLLKQKFSAPERLKFRAKESGYIDMNIIPLDLLNHKIAMDQMPGLLKAYLRMGARVSDGAFVDNKFNTIDVGLMIKTNSMNSKYKELYSGSKKK
ncbi:MAG: GNAT family N-acyltransferase [Paracoccaceae bacterium]|nr:GNAT family N-acyltransferase [Paracoccaceae bacterium]